MCSSFPLMILETVEMDTPAILAISLIVTETRSLPVFVFDNENTHSENPSVC